jgi:glucose-1-phosphate thymidylyltransferase
MKAILPAAGYATRLHPLTLSKPKALLEINGKPIIEQIIWRILKLKEIDEIVIVTNNKFFSEFERWKEGFFCDRDVRVINDGSSNEGQRLGTIGDIYFALKKENIGSDFIVVHADNYFSFDLRNFTDIFLERGSPVISLFDVGSLETAKKMGAVKLDSERKVTWFREKDENVDTSLCSIGIYAFPKWTLGYFRKYLLEGNSPDRFGDFIEWLYGKTEVYGYEFSGKEEYWFDIGSLEDYRKANKLMVQSKRGSR